MEELVRLENVFFSPAKDVMKENLINGKDCDIRLIQSALPSGQAGILGASSLIWLE